MILKKMTFSGLDLSGFRLHMRVGAMRIFTIFALWLQNL